jgi:hypothetical protein
VKIELVKLGALEFLAEYIYFGLYSRAGANVRMGASFFKDLYRNGQLEVSKLDLSPKKVICEICTVDKDEQAIKRLLTPGIKNVERKKLMKSLQERMREDYEVH